jgi:hypothetical protein
MIESMSLADTLLDALLAVAKPGVEVFTRKSLPSIINAEDGLDVLCDFAAINNKLDTSL